MPIVNCFTKNENIDDQLMDDLLNKWSEKIEVDRKDISINFINNFSQKGENYEFMVFMYLPTLWSQESIKRIQLSFLESIMVIFDVKAEDVFIITTKIDSGHVVENGEVLNW